jgi:hypothetical protein
MTDITIPPAALEAAAKAIRQNLIDKGVGLTHWEALDEKERCHWLEQARVACLAMLSAWPDMKERFFPNDPTRTPGIFLPLNTEPADDK